MADKRNDNTENNGQPAKKQHRGSDEPVASWDTSKLKSYLEKECKLDPSDTTAFSDEEIDGQVFIKLTEDHLKTIGIDEDKRPNILQIINSLKSDTEIGEQLSPETKVINDSIHGHIELPPLCVKIVDTPQFQRLRCIRQLGGAYYVYPGASHNRFEHSLGVCHLAGRLVIALRERQPELDITDEDILCVQIAGLCHDLGHGPFSHMFDGNFIPMINPKTTWEHEQASVEMFDYLVKDNGLIGEFLKYKLKKKDRIFIREQILGLKKPLNVWECEGRKEEKSFLYEVVANKRNGIDVDKWDYFSRDCHHLGIKNSVDHYRFIKYARVIKVEGQLQICTRDKEAGNVYEMFYTRHALHRKAYQHKVKLVTEYMISEAFVKANDHFKISGEGGKPTKLSEAIEDMVAYLKLTDHVFHQILYSTMDELKDSREILQRIEKRNFYKCVGQTQPDRQTQSGNPADNTISKDEIPKIKERIVEISGMEDILQEFRKQTGSDRASPLQIDDFVIIIADFNYGMKKKDPVGEVRFYNKRDQNTATELRKDDVSQMLPSNFFEQHIRMFCKKNDPASLDIANLSFRKWCNERTDMKKPKGGDDPPMFLTPCKRNPGRSIVPDQAKRSLLFKN